jgi:hypothetical protein
MGHDQLQRRKPRVHGPEPTPEGVPDLGGVVQGKMQEQTLGDAANLEVAVVGENLPPDDLAVGVRGVVQVLVPARPRPIPSAISRSARTCRFPGFHATPRGWCPSAVRVAAILRPPRPARRSVRIRTSTGCSTG